MTAKEISPTSTTIQKTYSIQAEDFFTALNIPDHENIRVVSADWILTRNNNGQLNREVRITVRITVTTVEEQAELAEKRRGTHNNM